MSSQITIHRGRLSYVEAYDMIRAITGIGAGNGPYIALHDGFMGLGTWAGFLTGSDRIVLDTHPYFAFSGGSNNQPFAVPGPDGLPGGVWPALACNAWGPGINTRFVVTIRYCRLLCIDCSRCSQSAFGVTIAGEFSNGYNDCGLFLKGTTSYTPSYGDCSMWNDYTTWNQTIRDGLMNFALASMDSLQHYFFWTWKVWFIMSFPFVVFS
jgi:glucan 1,3-beta-glucosidase